MPPRLRPRRQRPDNDASSNYFVYHGRRNQTIPKDVTFVRMASSIRRRVLDYGTFSFHPDLRHVILKEDLEEIGRHAFIDCFSLEEIDIPHAVRVIGYKAFANCSGLNRVIFGTGLEEIGEGSFTNCTSIHEIFIPNAVKVIGESAFHGSGLTRVTLGSGLEDIGGSAFSYCKFLHEIIIPNAIKKIHEYTFLSCSRLTNVTLCDGLEEIGYEAFRLTSIEHIHIPLSVRLIDANAFSRCYFLREIVIPNAVRAIKSGTFRNCSGLTTVTLHDGLEEIGVYAFRQCQLLSQIVIPNSVRAIYRGAFRQCSGLTTVILNNGLEKIWASAFKQCTSLVYILIPQSVREIDDNAFQSCSNLTNVQFCFQVEDFVSRLTWWDRGVHKRCPRTYSFLMKFNIPDRLGHVIAPTWRADIYRMLNLIPRISAESLTLQFSIIESILTLYERINLYPMLLELIIWKSEIINHLRLSNAFCNTRLKVQSRTDSIAKVNIIVPGVLSFLTPVNNAQCANYNLNEAELDDDDHSAFSYVS
jgi:hypothetical protein